MAADTGLKKIVFDFLSSFGLWIKKFYAVLLVISAIIGVLLYCKYK